MPVPYGKTLKRARERAGLSQLVLADTVGVSRDTVMRAEKSGNVGVLLLYRFADALDTDLTVAFGVQEAATTTGDDRSTLMALVSEELSDEQVEHVLRVTKRFLGEVVGTQ